MSVEAATTAIGSLRVTANTRQLALGAPADDDKSVFISLDATAQSVHQLVAAAEPGTAVFIRAPVATGKSTLAAYLPKYSDDYIYIDTGETEAEWRRNIEKVSGIDDPLHALSDPLKALSDKTLIFDEAHLLFSYPKLVSALLKLPRRGNAPKYLLFSAAAHGGSDGASAVTPNEIRDKYMWYPPLPNAKALATSLKEAGVFLSADSVGFFLKLCGGHRGIFMSAMAWVKEQQQQHQDLEDWDVAKSVTEVRASLARSITEDAGGWDHGFRSAIAQSRAVRVNSKYSELHNIPAVFADVLAGGAKKASELKKDHRALTIAGFVVPQQRSADSGEFVKYDWIDSGVRYGVANSMMAQYYRDKFASELSFQSQLIAGMDAPTSCADLLARALPFMSFVDVVDAPTSVDGVNQSSLSDDGCLPHEDHYNGAIISALKQLKFTVSQPLDGNQGKVDVYATLPDGSTCAVEVILATRPPVDHKEHVDRFGDAKKTNYSNAQHKCLVTIGQSSKTVLKRVDQTAADHGVDIIGLVVSQAHDSYWMYIKAANEKGVVQGPLFFACDRVAKSLDGNQSIVSAQELKYIDGPQEENQQEKQPQEEKQQQAELMEAKAALKEAKAELKEAKAELKEAKAELKEAKKDGRREDIERATQGASTAQKGVAAAQKMVSYLTDKITGM